MSIFTIFDDRHGDGFGEFPNLDAAMAELHRLAALPWDEEPNRCPCSNWRTCSRTLEIVEYESSEPPWTKLRRIPALEIGFFGARWLDEDQDWDWYWDGYPEEGSA